MATHPIRTRHWTRKEYEHLVELGVLHEDEPIELIGGQMIVAEPKNAPHPTAVGLIPGRLRDYSHAHPSRPVLVVEVADSSVSFDRRYKGSLYARASIADYWIVNLRRRVLEVYREPVRAPAPRFGWKYDRARILKPEATVSPLALPAATIAVADLLP